MAGQDSMTLDEATLLPVVRTQLADETATVTTWQVSPITQDRASSAGVYRITGSAQVQNRSLHWSLILKEIHAASVTAHAINNASADPTSNLYWKREMLVYQSGLVENLPHGFAVPRIYQIDERPDGCRLWMEEAHEEVGAVWPVSHYYHVARHFGRFSGMYLVERSLPTWPWLLTNNQRSRIQKSVWPEFARLYPELRHTDPLFQRGWTDELFAELDRTWHEREEFLHALDSLPRTLLHNDASRKNLVARYMDGTPQTVVFDWSQPAIGAIGEDLASLLSQPTYWFHGIQPEDLYELQNIALDGYIEGLSDMGWRGDPTLARLGYLISIVLRVAYSIFNFEWAARDENTRLFIEKANGHPIEETVDVMRRLRPYLVACADEARQLMATPF